MNYTGWKEVTLTESEMALFYEGRIIPESFGLLENQYLILKNQNDEIIDKYCWRDSKLSQVRFQTLESSFSGKMKPRNIQQELAFDMLKDDNTTVKLISGSFGTGKTYALAAAAMEALEKKKFEKIVWVRNNVQVKDTDQLGALPGLI